MDKLKMHSPNFAEENIAKLAELFPNCVTEVLEPQIDTDKHRLGSKENIGDHPCSSVVKKAIDFDLLRQELSTHIVEGPQERYHLNWPGKREALLTANAPIAKTLRPCREESLDFDTTENLFIEGDNLDALKLLQETYLGKVKMIYIDPPYNRGDDLLYKDDFAEGLEEYLYSTFQVDEEGNKLTANTDANGRFHSDWLSMIYMRLRLARNLLSDNGVIFISIGDDELCNLKNGCNEIFGEKNYLGTILWKKKTNGNNMGYIPPVHDYIVCFAKNANDNSLLGFPLTKEFIDANYSNPDNDPKGLWTTSDLSANHEGPIFEITNPNTGKSYWPAKGRYWVFNEAEVKKRITDGRIIFGKTGNAGPIQKKFLSERENKRIKPESWWDSHGMNSDGTAEIAALFAPKVFDHPKPTTLMKNIIDISTEKNDIVLDFFAGSGSTADAVMQQNLIDGGQRKFIIVQFPEIVNTKSIAYRSFGFQTISELTKERIRRAGKKIKANHELTRMDTNKEKDNDLFNNNLCELVSISGSKDLDIGFRVLKVDSSNMADVYYTPDTVEQNLLTDLTSNIKDDRSFEDLLFQVLLDWGVDLTLPITKETISDREVFFVDGNALTACFEKDGQITEDFCKELAGRQPLRVVFRDSGFKDDSVKINVEQIFKLMSPHTDVKTI